MNIIGSENKPLEVAIIGSGPSGYYAAQSLFGSEKKINITMFDRLPTPYGLVRGGVAPDHQKIKNVIRVYEKISISPGFQFIGNVLVGKDISIDDLRNNFHATIFACGAETDRKLGIPGEDLQGSHTATAFVGWYNGHPDYRDLSFDLSQEIAVVVGQGNVAADVSRILSKTADELKQTDIADHALQQLAESKIKEIHVIGRRGPVQAKFTPEELKEFGELGDCNPVVDSSTLQLNEASQKELESPEGRTNVKNFEVFKDFANRELTKKNRSCFFRFLEGPIELMGTERLEGILLAKNSLSGDPFKQRAEKTGETVEQKCGILFRSIGYNGIPIEGVPFDEKEGIFPNDKGRLLDNGSVVNGVYVTGWIKRGPSGIIGTNKPDSVETVNCLLEDIEKIDGEKSGNSGIMKILSEKQTRAVNYDGWKKIDEAEVKRGEPKGKPREKFTRIEEMLDIIK
ncbi:MAG: FAD-dependent oxidoreductase [Pseudomonadota bacterium]|nr:FAD-dependent oxidoreductase [Pseudomonadota bacterium]